MKVSETRNAHGKKKIEVIVLDDDEDNKCYVDKKPPPPPPASVKKNEVIVIADDDNDGDQKKEFNQVVKNDGVGVDWGKYFPQDMEDEDEDQVMKAWKMNMKMEMKNTMQKAMEMKPMNTGVTVRIGNSTPYTQGWTGYGYGYGYGYGGGWGQYNEDIEEEEEEEDYGGDYEEEYYPDIMDYGQVKENSFGSMSGNINHYGEDKKPSLFKCKDEKY